MQELLLLVMAVYRLLLVLVLRLFFVLLVQKAAAHTIGMEWVP